MFNFHRSLSSEYVETADEFPVIDDSLSYSSRLSGYKKTASFNKYIANFIVSVEPHEEDRRLANWYRWLDIRKKLHSSLGNALNRKPPSLVMNSIEDVRYLRQEKDLLHLANIYFKPDKFRGSPHFWQPPILLSDKGKPELPDCAVTRNKVERGIFSLPDNVDTPTLIRKEKGVYDYEERCGPKVDWNKSGYVKQRKSVLEKEILRIQKHKPALEKLVIQGKSVFPIPESAKPLPVLTVSGSDELYEVEEDASTESILSVEDDEYERTACLKIQNSKFYWKTIIKGGKSKKYPVIVCDCDGERNFSFVFSTHVNEKCTHFLKFENIGTMKLIFWWRQRKCINTDMPLSSLNVTFNHFFFNKNDGLILPGQNLEVPIWFHSRTPGVFKEVWELTFIPRVTEEDNPVTIRLWGLADKPDTVTSKCSKIEEYLEKREQETAAQKVIDDLVRRVNFPTPPIKKGYDSIYPDEKCFQQINPGYFYHPNVVNSLRELYIEVVQDPSKEWDLNLKNLRHLILQASSDVAKQKEQLALFCNNVRRLLSPSPMPCQSSAKFSTVRNILCIFANNVEQTAEELKSCYAFKAQLTTKENKQEKYDDINKSVRHRLTDSEKKKAKKKESKIKLSSSKSGGGSKHVLAIQPSQFASNTMLTPDTESVAIDSNKYAQYREALFIKVYHHLGTAVEQISAVLESLKTVE